MDMIKRTVYFPDWMEERISRWAELELRSFSSQVVYELQKHMFPPSPYFEGWNVDEAGTSNLEDSDEAVIL